MLFLSISLLNQAFFLNVNALNNFILIYTKYFHIRLRAYIFTWKKSGLGSGSGFEPCVIFFSYIL